MSESPPPKKRLRRTDARGHDYAGSYATRDSSNMHVGDRNDRYQSMQLNLHLNSSGQGNGRNDDRTAKPIPRDIFVGVNRNPSFLGRNDLLSTIHDYFKPPNEPGSDISSYRTFVIYGLGGMGKTQIAAQYCFLHENEYNHKLWMPSGDPEGLAERYSAISSLALDDHDSTDQSKNIDVAREWLSTTDDPWLLVFDNVTETTDLEKYLPSRSNTSCSIIITTQTRVVNLSGAGELDVDGMPPDDGAQLLLKISRPNISRPTAGDQMAARELSELVGGLPLAITQIGGYIKSSSMTFKEFQDLYHKEKKSSWYGKRPPKGAAYKETLETVFNIALEALGPEQRNLLDCIAFMSPENIWEDIFFHGEHHDECLQFLDDDVGGAELRGEVVGRCLVTRHNIDDDGIPVNLSIHRSLKKDLIYRLTNKPDDSDYQRVFRQAVHLLRAATPRQSPRSSPTGEFESFEKRLPHVLSLRSIYDNSQTSTKKLKPILEFAELLSDIGNYMWERNLLDYAFDTLGTAEAICNDVLDVEDPNPIRTQINYLQASFELDHGCSMRKQGLDHKQQILRLRKKKSESSAPDEKETDELQMSTAANNLGCAYIQCEDYESAAPLLQEALAIKLRWGDETSDKTASGIAEQYKNLALVAISRGQIEEALNLSKRAVDIVTKWPQAKRTSKLFHRFMQASVIFNSGDTQVALANSIDVLIEKTEVLDQDSNELFDSYYAVAMMQHISNDLERAEYVSSGKLCPTKLMVARFNLRKCLEFKAKNYEASVARVIYRLSLVLRDQGKPMEATRVLSEARDLKGKILEQGNFGVDLEEQDEAVIFDQMVTCWAGRYTGKQNVQWQRENRLRRGEGL